MLYTVKCTYIYKMYARYEQKSMECLEVIGCHCVSLRKSNLRRKQVQGEGKEENGIQMNVF